MVHSLQARKHGLDLSASVAITLIQQMASLYASRDVWLLFFFHGLIETAWPPRPAQRFFFFFFTGNRCRGMQSEARLQSWAWDMANKCAQWAPSSCRCASLDGCRIPERLCAVQAANSITYTSTPTRSPVCVRGEGGFLGELRCPFCTTFCFLRHHVHEHNTSN